MVARKPLPQDYSPASMGGTGSDDIPDVLRPGGNRNRPYSPSSSRPSQDAPSADSNFESEEQSVWRQQGYQPQQQQQQQRPQAIPTILLQTATGSSTASALSDTNPFKRKMLSSDIYTASPITAPSSIAAPSYGPPPPPSQPPPPIADFSRVRMDDQSAQNPWQPGSFDNSRTTSASPTPLPTIVDAGEAESAAGENAWAAQAHAMASGGPPPTKRPAAGASSFRNSNLISFPSDEEPDNADWADVASVSQPSTASSTVVSAAPPPRPPFTPLGGKEAESSVYEDSHAWDDVGGKIAPNPQAMQLDTEATGEGWNPVDTEPVPGQLSRQSTWEDFSDEEDERNKATKPQSVQPSSSSQPQQPVLADAISSSSKAKGKAVDPAASPSNAQEPLVAFDSSPHRPSNQFDDSIFSAPMSVSPSSQKQDTSAANEDFAPQLPPRSMLDVNNVPPPPHPPRPVDSSKTETYQVKLVTWFDTRATQNPRISPILVQNINGPCPLVALVNALTMTTPADTTTALVEALGTREQVSLDLLLDNVFDELMSPRRSREISLPDVGELYSFLKGLHTGMNVNPRYISTAEVVTSFRRTSLTHLHPTEREEMIPGTFENTREMQLYATFSIPLIHGWLPAKAEPAYDALSRQASSYEDVQNLLFREEELEEKLSSPHNEEGLSLEEQGLYQDILEIKTFLNVSATQLTSFGLGVLSKAMIPGTFAILFRNDHFSTLYLHPDTMQLMSLVTDAGYASHDEVVWETLVDVNGEHTEYFSGDFRLVGGNTGGAAVASGRGSGNTGRGRRRRSEDQAGGPSTEPSVAIPGDELSRHEQEDRDLALALQLQEEEEAQQRDEEARRQSRLSEQYIEQNGRRRRSSASVPQGRRPSNAAGGGRYSSTSGRQSQQITITISPRRSSAGVYANNSSLSVAGGGSRTGSSTSLGRTSTTSAPGGRRSTPQQVVRPLVPPATTAAATSATSNTSVGPARIVNGRPAIHRAQDGEEDADAPPSYEHAAMQAPYHPPPGAPGSETATLAGTDSNTSTNDNRRTSPAASTASPAPSLGAQRLPGGLPQPPRVGMGYATQSGRPYVTPGRYGQPSGMAGNRQDRECIIM